MNQFHPTRFSRRRFLGAGIQAVSAAVVLSRRADGAAPPRQTNPFAYDLSRQSKTDPSLIHFKEVKRFRSPHGRGRRLAFGPDERLYIAGGNYVSIVDRAGQPVADKALTGEARAVAVAPDGTIYVGLRDHVEAIAPQQDRATAWASPGKRVWITGLAVSQNNVFAADSGNRVVLRYDRSGKLVGRIGERDPDRKVPGLVLPSPYLDVDLHPDGLLRVNNPGRHQVEAYTFEGSLELTWGKPSAGMDGFCGCCNPVSLAPLPDGRIVTCEKGLPRVKVYSVHGQFESVVAGVESFPENARAGTGDDASDGMLSGLDAAVDPKGRIYVLDLVTGEIRIMERTTPPSA